MTPDIPSAAAPEAAMAFAIRPAVAADVPAMHAVRLNVRENILRDPTRVTEADYHLRLQRGDGAWVCEIGATLAGFAFVDREEQSVWALFVDPAREGLGVGRRLLRTLLDWSFEQGLKDLVLTTERGTRAALFYERAGWEWVRDLGRDDCVFRMTRGRWRSFQTKT